MKFGKLTRADIVRKGGPSRPTLYRIENDPTYSPESFTIDRLADALGVNRVWLRTGEGEMLPPINLPQWEVEIQSGPNAPKVPGRKGTHVVPEGAAESAVPYLPDEPPLDRELLGKVIKTTLEEGRDLPADQLVTVILGTYDFIQKTGTTKQVRDIVKMGLS